MHYNLRTYSCIQIGHLLLRHRGAMFYSYIYLTKQNKETSFNKFCFDLYSEFQSVLQRPSIPNTEQLEENKIERIRNHQVFKMLSQLALYSGLLYIVYTISYEARDQRSFHFKDHMITMFKYDESVCCY